MVDKIVITNRSSDKERMAYTRVMLMQSNREVAWFVDERRTQDVYTYTLP